MRYATFIYETTEGIRHLTDLEYQALIDQHQALQDRQQHPEFRGCGRLVPSVNATSLSSDNNDLIVSDGPFAECKEILVGFYLSENSDLKSALNYAGKIPTSTQAGVEVRPIETHSTNGLEPIERLTDTIDSGDDCFFLILNYLGAALFDALGDKDRQQLVDANVAMMSKAQKKGHYLLGEKLMPAVTATSIRHTNGPHDMVDGPFTEAKEVLLGFHILSCNSREGVIQYASQLPEARAGTVEVREIDYLIV